MRQDQLCTPSSSSIPTHSPSPTLWTTSAHGKGPRGPIHGIPILIKENIGTADRMQTTAGSLALEGSRPRRDSFVAARLRAAGAVILGKTNLSEWANFRGNGSSSGWSARGGQTKNPYALDRTPCGSSSGTGAAIAASLAAGGIGTETDGSIVLPILDERSSLGVKPTVGLVSRSGIIPIAVSQDTAGPMTRSVRDAALPFVRRGRRGPKAIPRRPSREASHRWTMWRHSKDDALRGAPHRRRALSLSREHRGGGGCRSYSGGHESRGSHPDRQCYAVPGPNAFNDKEGELFFYEFKAGINAYLAEVDGAQVHDLAELIAFNEAHRDRELSLFGQELFVKAQTKGRLTSDPYVRIRTAIERSAREGIDKPMEKDHLDAIVAVTTGPAWLIDHVNGDSNTGAAARASPPSPAIRV